MFAPLASPFVQPLIPGQRYDPHTYLELAHARNLGLTVSGSPSLEPCQNGIGYRSSGTNKFSTSIDFGAGSGSPTLSIYVVTVFTLLSNSGRDIFIGGVDFPWELENNSGTLRAYFNGTYQTLETAVIGKLYTSVWTSAANSNTIAQYLNGSKVLSATAAITGLLTFTVGEGYPGFALGNTLIHRVYVGRGRSLSDDEAIALSLTPWGQIAPYRRGLVGDFAAGGGAQALTPGLVTNSQTFYAPTAAPGEVALTPSLFSNSQTFHAPTVSAANSLTPGLLENSVTFFSPSVAPGEVTLTPSLFTDGDTFYAPEVTQDGGGTQTLSPGLFTNSNTFFAATVTPGEVSLLPGVFADGDTFFTPDVSTDYVLLPALFSNTQSFFSPTVAGDGALFPELLTNTSVFYSPTVTRGGSTLSQADIDAIADAVWAHPKALTLGKYLGLR